MYEKTFRNKSTKICSIFLQFLFIDRRKKKFCVSTLPRATLIIIYYTHHRVAVCLDSVGYKFFFFEANGPRKKSLNHSKPTEKIIDQDIWRTWWRWISRENQNPDDFEDRKLAGDEEVAICGKERCRCFVCYRYPSRLASGRVPSREEVSEV